MIKCYIYRHWIVNDKNIVKSYIGRIMNNTPNGRWGVNGQKYKPRKNENPTKMWKAILKYGWDNFNHEIVLAFECETKEEANFWLDEWEKYYIEKYNSYYNGYNETLGGQGVIGYSGLKGNKNPMYGKKHTDDAKRKMKNSQRKIVESEDYVNAFAERKHTKESKEKISQSVKDYYKHNEHPWKGRKHTEESKKKNRQAHAGKMALGNNPRAKKVVCINTGKEFSCFKEAADWCGLKKGQPISWVCEGKRRTAGKHPKTGEKLCWKLA